ncbi:universal stress protein UspA, partial [Escherichia coli]|nr:universal stress protein UspA [Escherichia coli]
SVSEYTAAHAPCDVIIVHAKPWRNRKTVEKL